MTQTVPRGRRAAIALLASYLLALTIAAVSAGRAATRPDGHLRTVGYGQVRFDGLGPEAWAARYRQAHRRLAAMRRRYAGELQLLAERPRTAIALMFGPYAGQALTVSSCEAGPKLSTRAHNGQHLGLFQMGRRERQLYGDGSSALAQARAAYVYFVVSGRDWSPWTCKP